MIRLKYTVASVATTGVLVAAGAGVASAATSKNPDVGKSGISRTVLQQDRLQAAATVLNTTPANIQSAHKNKTFKTLLSQAGLTRQQFEQKARAQLTSELEAQGYSQDQITIALQHREIVHLKHRD